MPALIELTEVRKAFTRGPEEIRAVDGLSLEIERGDYLTVVGPSGSGKTTLLNLIGCIDKPSSGSVRISDVETGELNEAELARVRSSTVGIVFQQFFLVPTLTALENVTLPDMFAVVRRSGLEKRARELLDMVGLAGRADHYPSELSGGELQRVAVARALMNDPVILLADEPTGNLDSRSAEEIMSMFERLNDRGLTMVVVTHNSELARRSRGSVFLKDGKVESSRRLRQPASVAETEEAKEEPVGEKGYLPVAQELQWKAPLPAVLTVLAGALMFLSAFLGWVLGSTGYGLVSMFVYPGSTFGGNLLVRTYGGGGAVIFTGLWPMVLAVIIMFSGLAVLARYGQAAAVVLVTGLVGVLISLANIVVIYSRLQVGGVVGGSAATVHPGPGIWLFLAFSIVATGVATWTIRARRRWTAEAVMGLARSTEVNAGD